MSLIGKTQIDFEKGRMRKCVSIKNVLFLLLSCFITNNTICYSESSLCHFNETCVICCKHHAGKESLGVFLDESEGFVKLCNCSILHGNDSVAVHDCVESVSHCYD